MTLSELKPDIALKALLEGIQLQEEELQDGEETPSLVAVYGQGETPNINLDDAFIAIGANGLTETVTRPIGMFKGVLAVVISVKCYDDGTVNNIQISELLGQIERRCFYKTYGEYYFEPYKYAVILNTSTDTTTGYATTVLNISWHTIHK